MKNLPNILTISRIVLSVVLLFVKTLSIPFLVVFFLCGLTDIFDGFIARKTNNCTKLGSILDSVADFVFVAICCITILLTLKIDLYVFCIIAFVALIKEISILINYIKYKKLVSIHTILNKLAGLVLFCLVFLINIVDFKIIIIISTCFAMVSSFEELILSSMSKELNLNEKSIFTLKKKERF